MVGTVAVETSDFLSKKTGRAGVPHEVLNAKNHYRKAQIIMNAGQRGAVTIATNMAGRGTDIKLGEGFVNLVDFVSLVQNAMKVAVLIISFVDVQGVKETQVSHNSTCLLKMI